MKNKSISLLVWSALIFTLVVPLSVAAQEPAPDERNGKWKLGADIGVILATADEEAFGMNFYGDYYFNQNVSIGPLIQFGFTGDLFQIGPSVQLKYTHDFDNRWKAHAQGGLGYTYAHLNRRGPNVDDSSVLLPFGGGIEYRFTDRLSAGTTVLFNIMDLDKVGGENFSLSFLGGIKFRF
jgi:hypothetical protein